MYDGVDKGEILLTFITVIFTKHLHRRYLIGS